MTDSVSSPTSPSVRARQGADDYDAFGRELCRRHAAPLLTMAAVLIDDIDTAVDIVARTLTAACRNRGRDSADDDETRVRLARSVYHRCLGHLTVMERFPELSRPKSQRAPSPFDHLSADQALIVALVVFGGHDTAQAATTLSMPMSAIIDQLPRLPARADGAAPRVRPAPPRKVWS